MRENDVRIVGANGRGYELNCGENRGWRARIPESIERWQEELVEFC